MAGKLQETLEETQRRLALGSVTTAPMMQTLDNRHRARRGPTVGRVLAVVAVVIGVLMLIVVGLFLIGLASEESGEIAALTIATNSRL